MHIIDNNINQRKMEVFFPCINNQLQTDVTTTRPHHRSAGTMGTEEGGDIQSHIASIRLWGHLNLSPLCVWLLRPTESVCWIPKQCCPSQINHCIMLSGSFHKTLGQSALNNSSIVEKYDCNRSTYNSPWERDLKYVLQILPTIIT